MFPTGSDVWSFGPQQVALFREVMDILGGVGLMMGLRCWGRGFEGW